MKRQASGSFLKKRLPAGGTKKLLLNWALGVETGTGLTRPSTPYRPRPGASRVIGIAAKQSIFRDTNSVRAGVPPLRQPPATNKSFLVLFFKKEPLPSLVIAA
jgi:hypothetical protein